MTLKIDIENILKKGGKNPLLFSKDDNRKTQIFGSISKVIYPEGSSILQEQTGSSPAPTQGRFSCMSLPTQGEAVLRGLRSEWGSGAAAVPAGKLSQVGT